MNIKQLNEEFYAKKAFVGTANHCTCEDCVFYAEQIMKNEVLVEFLLNKGLDPRKADEVWCYNEEDDFKYYTVDFFEVYTNKEETHCLGNAKVTFKHNIYAEKEILPNVCTIDVVLKPTSISLRQICD